MEDLIKPREFTFTCERCHHRMKLSSAVGVCICEKCGAYCYPNFQEL